MMSLTQAPPLSLYIHLPWCVRKCPYCDFNSHTAPDALPEEAYVKQLLQDASHAKHNLDNRPIISIFIGGGTPSLFSGQAIGSLLHALSNLFSFAENIEITLEANPGTVDENRFIEFRAAGVNRLSIGVQSFHDEHLKILGRIHNSQKAQSAIAAAEKAKFERLNIDLMHGLPTQTPEQATRDLEIALRHSRHVSWYQLTLEPHTPFYRTPPALPEESVLHAIQDQGLETLTQAGLRAYEVSAYAANAEDQCRHNLNYWKFGDYLGIGAGAHSKLTDVNAQRITRQWRVKHPKAYLAGTAPFIEGENDLTPETCVFEFMMNALRLQQAIPFAWFEDHCGLPIQIAMPHLKNAAARGFLTFTDDHLALTSLGRRFLDDVVSLFLP